MENVMALDTAMLYFAVSDTSASGGPPDTAFFNRLTGEIAFVFQRAEDAESYGVPPLENAARRAAVESRPSDWVEVPKYNSRYETSDIDAFIAEFLKKNGWESGEKV
jgi:hypothetical protein